MRALRYAAAWILFNVILLSSCNTKPMLTAKTVPTTPAPLTGQWQVIGVYNEDQSIMTAGFLDELHVATGGVVGQMAYSSDGADTWLETEANADCRYGIEIVSPKVIWTCGGATNVRKSIDGGKTWKELAAFGNFRTITNPCHSMSFLDENIGWLANSDLFGTTTDGGASWIMQDIPETAKKIATIDTFGSGMGYLLDQNGVLFYTADDGQHWSETSQLELGTLAMPRSVYQMAAMRFSDKEHGMIVISSADFGSTSPIMAFHTSDGGNNWISEIVPIPAGPVYISRNGNLLTVISEINQLTLLRYE